jgi:hypothetical protein
MQAVYVSRTRPPDKNIKCSTTLTTICVAEEEPELIADELAAAGW